MNPEKYGIITRLKNMSDFRELFYKDHVECDFKVLKICGLKVRVLTDM